MNGQEILTRPTARQLAGLDPRPTRVVAEPLRVKGENSNAKRVVFPCDDGRLYTSDALAELLGCKKDVILYRLRHYGWRSELMLKPKGKPGRAIDGRLPGDYAQASSGNAAWRQLSAKPRNERLARIGRPGEYESMMYASRNSSAGVSDGQ